MADMKSLAKDTAIYGVSSILGKFLNWCLVPFYSYVLPTTGDYGMVTDLYNWTAVAYILLTYGMETGFFRFVNKSEENPHHVYSTTLTSVAATSLFFIVVCLLFNSPISQAMGYGAHPEFIWMMCVIVAIDAFSAIPFAFLRYKKRPIAFASLKMVMIFSNIFLNVFLLWLCPLIYGWKPGLVDWFFVPNYGVGYAFVANFLSSIIGLMTLVPYMWVKWIFDRALLNRMLKYSLPLLILGLAGIMNQSFDKIVFKYLFDDQQEALKQLGIYGASFRIGVVMMMFTQAFRYAYEPFVFSKQKTVDNQKAYADAMKYFIIFSVFIFLGVMYFMDILQYLIRSDYREGLVIVPIVLVCFIFQGVYFNLSFWYKLSEKTQWGAIIALIGSIATIAGNILFVPRFGYIGSAWVVFVCFFLMMVISWMLGQKYYPIAYDLKSAGRYTLLGAAFYLAGMYVPIDALVIRLIYRSILLVLFTAYILRTDLPVKDLPILNKMFKKNSRS
jgi:O-antigen/teichoic acid export membrane protein